MSITVNTNMPSLIAQKSLLYATNSMNTALQRMSTGYRINSSKDDAAGMAISNKFEYKTSSYQVAKNNAQMGESMLETANSSLSNINSMLQRIRDLTEQASNGTYGEDERNAIQMEINALTEEIYRVKNTTEFNGKNLFSAETSTVSNTSAPDLKPVTVLTPTMSMADVTFDNWSSTENQIIGISSAQELLKLSNLTNDPNNTIDTENRTFVLTSDIDLNDLGDVDGNGSNWIPIANACLENLANNHFGGEFNGNGYTISNMKMVNLKSISAGFIGQAENSTISNIKFENVSIESTLSKNDEMTKVTIAIFEALSSSTGLTPKEYELLENYTGCVIGTICTGASECTFDNCVVSNANLDLENKNSAYVSVGGFVGVIDGSIDIKNCYFDGDITNTTSKPLTGGLTGDGDHFGVGGFVGYTSDTADISIKNSDVVVDIKTRDVADLDLNDATTETFAGGLVGGGWGTTNIDGCSVKGSIDSNAGLVGGLVGCCGQGSISNCEVGVDMTISSDSNDYVGSFVGLSADTTNFSNNTYKNSSTTEGAELPVICGIMDDAGNISPLENDIAGKIENSANISNVTPGGGTQVVTTKCNLQVGINNDENSILQVDTSFDLGSFSVSVKTDDSARKALTKIDELMEKVSNKMTEIGATQNRLESVIEAQETQIMTMSSANSLIKDADIAEESSNYIKSQILQQTTASLLATANQCPSIALQLV